MPGRQAHGRSLTAAPKAKKAGKNSKARAQKNALNAFGIAQEHFPSKVKKTPRFRELDADIEHKRGRGDDDDDEDDEDEEDQPQRKKPRAAHRPGDEDVDYGSDSEGNEWQLGGMADDDDDSEIESDDAFGDSDNEKFDEYHFRGSKAKKSKQKNDSEGDDDDEGDSDDEEGETLGAEAIDLATALDQWEEDSEDEPEEGSGSDDDDNSDQSGESDSDDEDAQEVNDEDDTSDDEADPEKLEALQGLVSGFGTKAKKGDNASSRQKINIGDLGLSGLDDPFIKNSVKLMNKEEKEKRPGATKKLDIPVSRREQGRIDRAAAYEKTNETLDRWNDTVKQNRRADHLVFPLPLTDGNAGLNTTELQPLSSTHATNELESTMMSLLDQSGLSMDKPKKEKPKVYDDDGNELSNKEILNRKRLERELAQREAKRAARVKKIKSKAYHRVHRKQKEREAAGLEEDGEVDSEAEREAQDRRRALERVGQRHKDSKWAKIGNRAKRAVWDDGFRTGLNEMARKDDELRRRKEGKMVDSDDDTSSPGSDSEDDATLLRKLEAVENEDEEPSSRLEGMKFMRNAAAGRKQMEAEELERIKKELRVGSDGPASDEEKEVGRRTYGGPAKNFSTALDTSERRAERRDSDDEDDEEDEVEIQTTTSKAPAAFQTNEPSAAATKSKWSSGLSRAREPAAEDSKDVVSTVHSGTGQWSQGKARHKETRSSAPESLELDVATVIKRPAPKKASAQQSSSSAAKGDQDDSDESETENHLPLAIRDQTLLDRAFAGDDTMAEFEAEKADVAEADDDKVIDNTIPGWGSWVGEGVSKREQERQRGRFLTKVEGIKKKDRQDAKLDKVIINEKRIKKNGRYLASQLPHPFESRAQYERSLRLPVGPEWQTKETFQDSTKPRVLMKQGVIAPMAKPK